MTIISTFSWTSTEIIFCLTAITNGILWIHFRHDRGLGLGDREGWVEVGGGWAKGSSAPPIFAHTHFRCLPNRLVYRLTQISLVGRRWRQCDQIWWNSATLDKFWTSLATFEGLLGCGGGQVVRVLAVYSDDPSSKPADANSFSVKFCLKRMKINQKDAGVGPFNITFEGLNFK